jgi:hypothetical protein
MFDEYENCLFDKISVCMSSREMVAEVFLSLGNADTEGGLTLCSRCRTRFS